MSAPEPTSKKNKSSSGSGIAVFVLALGFLAWVGAVALFAYRKTGDYVWWDYSFTGQFGDSFGVIGAVMASGAAYFAFRTYRETREANATLEADRADERKRAAEPSYLNLLERRYSALDRVRMNENDAEWSLTWLVKASYGPGAPTATVLENYNRSVDRVKNIGQYLRFMYHIVSYADRHFEGGISSGRPAVRTDLAYEYIRLFRSQLTDDEILLIAINANTDRGAGWRAYIERYALLHNLPPLFLNDLKAREIFAQTAFGLPSDESS